MTSHVATSEPAWAAWRARPRGGAYTLGIEEEVMLLHPRDWSLAQRIETVLPRLSPELAAHVTTETHRSAIELATGVHSSVADAADELRGLRRALATQLEPLELDAAAAGIHPFAVWQDTVVSDGARYQFLHGSMRELARREPTFALHVHVGVPEPEAAIDLANRLRGHLPMFLALSANSPFWQGRDTGLASARTPLFGAFPRVGIPRAFRDYAEYTEAVDLLIACEAFPDPTFLWWDVRPQPRFGTVEVRIMDSQTTVEETAGLAALVQSVARLELMEGFVSPKLLALPEVLHENRFLAARDGVRASLIDPDSTERRPLTDSLDDLLTACRPHADALGCEAELAVVPALARENGALRQLAQARADDRLPGLVKQLAAAFC
jgi:carboxylate-amine ligase